MVIYFFARDSLRDECQDDNRYLAMMKVSLAIIFLVSLSAIYHSTHTIALCFKICQTSIRRSRTPPILSSDEEDDK